MKKEKVLFVCIHNSARSQMAEAWLNTLYGDRFEAKSAGLEPGTLNPLVVGAMDEVGIDISRNRTKSVYDFFKRGDLFSWVITVCDEASRRTLPRISRHRQAPPLELPRSVASDRHAGGEDGRHPDGYGMISKRGYGHGPPPSPSSSQTEQANTPPCF